MQNIKILKLTFIKCELVFYHSTSWHIWNKLNKSFWIKKYKTIDNFHFLTRFLFLYWVLVMSDLNDFHLEVIIYFLFCHFYYELGLLQCDLAANMINPSRSEFCYFYIHFNHLIVGALSTAFLPTDPLKLLWIIINDGWEK